MTIDAGLKDIGHVVLPGLWPLSFLGRLRNYAFRSFFSYDTELELPSCGLAEVIAGTALPGILRELFGGSFVLGRNESVMRRADPRSFSVTGLHVDGQLQACAKEGIRSKRELTLWTPLQSCLNDDIPRLLLLHRGETFVDLFSDDEQIEAARIKYQPIQLSPVKERPADLAARVESQMLRLLEKRRCYSPKIALGDAILFEHDVIHGSYCRAGMTTTRYSFDIRFVGEYRTTRENMHYDGVLFDGDEISNIQPLLRRTAMIGADLAWAAFHKLSRRRLNHI